MVFIALLLSVSCGANRIGPYDYYPKPSNSIRVTTYNINWQEGAWEVGDPENNLAALKKTQSDIILLQETTPFWEKKLRKQFKHKYQFYHDHKQSGGLAILSRYPITKHKVINGRYGWFPALFAVVETPRGPIQILNLHLIPPLTENNRVGVLIDTVLTNHHIRLRDTMDFERAIDPRMPSLIVGDLNEGKSGPSVKYLRVHGYIDALASLPEETATWYWPVGPFTFTARFDRIFYSPHFTLKQIQVLPEGDSDHFPVSADLWKVNEH